MADCKPGNYKKRKKEAYSLEKEGLHNIVRVYAILMIISAGLTLIIGIGFFFR